MLLAIPQTPPPPAAVVAAEPSRPSDGKGMVSRLTPVGPPRPQDPALLAKLQRPGRGVAMMVVPVEDRAMHFEADLARNLNSGRIGKLLGLSLYKPVMSPKYAPMVPFWMDLGTVRSGPNVIQKSYPIGWGY